MTPVRSSMAEVLLCLKRDPSSSSNHSREDIDLSLVSNQLSIPSVEGKEEEEVVCNCKKSRCLKLYCQCFAAQIVCNPTCKCTTCANTAYDLAERDEAVKLIIERNPLAFDSKFKNEVNVEGALAAHKTGCRCRKSMCLKKYCECFHGGVACSSVCTCLQCANTLPPPPPPSLGPDSISSLAVPPLRPASPATVASTTLKSTPEVLGINRFPTENNEDSMIRAAQDLALLRNKADSRPSPVSLLADVTKSSFYQSSQSTVGQSNSCGGFSLEQISARKNFGDIASHSVLEQCTPIHDGAQLKRRKRIRIESSLEDQKLITNRPPSILGRGGSSNQPKYKSLSRALVASKFLRGESNTNPPNTFMIHGDDGEASKICDLSMLSTSTFKRQAPSSLRISSASPNSLHCASALSLLSGRDMSPKCLSESPSAVKFTSFFSISPTASPPPFSVAPHAEDLSMSKCGNNNFTLSEIIENRRQHSNSMDNTSEEDNTSDSPHVHDIASSVLPPPLYLPERQESYGHCIGTVLYNSKITNFPQNVEYFNDSNWTKPVVDVMSKLL